MPNWIKFPLVLTIICCISAGGLTMLYKLTLPVKQSLAATETELALKWILPSAEEFTKINDKASPYYIAKNKNNKVIGYAITDEANGYAGPIKVMIGVDPLFKIIGTRVLYQNETPGLGDKIVEVISNKTWGTVIKGNSSEETNLKPHFQVQFEGKQTPVKLKQDGGEIEAITGATISSRAFVTAINNGVGKLKELLSSKSSDSK